MNTLSSLWQGFDGNWMTGYLQHPDLGFLQGAKLLEHFAEATNEEQLSHLLRKANGCFALILNTAFGRYAAVDKIRSLPLFWDSQQNLADKSEALAALKLKALHSCPPEILNEYLITGYVTGSDTLHPEIKQIPAGHYLKLEAGPNATLKCYYRYVHHSDQTGSVQAWIDKLHKLHLSVAQDVLASLQGRTVVIPLSGGYDSRLLAYLFSKLDYQKIITFSYDSPRLTESRLSQATARFLKLPWVFIEHSHKSWYKAFNSDERKAFYRFSVNASSSAHIQDWLAVQEMQRQKLIPADSVFMPGHSADFLQGSHLPAVYGSQSSFTKTELIQQILNSHYRLWPQAPETDRQSFAIRIQNTIQAPEMLSAEAAATLFEYWDLQERQAKFIVNSLRVYESFGYDWRLPLWDARLMDFWAQVPLELRVGRRLWLLYAQQHLPIPVPVFKYPPWGQRIIDKVLRILWGEIRNVRYGRFAQYQNPIQYAQVKAESYLNPQLNYPSFVDADKAMLRCDMNALQALISLAEIKD